VDNNDWAGNHWLKVLLVVSEPFEEQQQRVDLVVVSTTRKGEQLILEIGQLQRVLRQQDATGFEAALLAAHPRHLVGLGFAADDIEAGLFL
jgi:hypothetical protein